MFEKGFPNKNYLDIRMIRQYLSIKMVSEVVAEKSSHLALELAKNLTDQRRQSFGIADFLFVVLDQIKNIINFDEKKEEILNITKKICVSILEIMKSMFRSSRVRSLSILTR